MKLLSLGVCVLALVGGGHFGSMENLTQETDIEFADREFAGKILVVELGDRQMSYTVTDGFLTLLGRRVFLMGTPVNASDPNSHTTQIAIAWDEVTMLTIQDAKRTFRNTDPRQPAKEVSRESEFERLTITYRDIEAALRREQRVIAGLKFEVGVLRAKNAQERNADKKMEYGQQIDDLDERIASGKEQMASWDGQRHQIRAQIQELQMKLLMGN